MPLGTVRLRLDRSKTHLDALKLAVDDASGSNRYGVRREFEADGAQHVYYAVVSKGLLEQFSLILSDCLHSLRSCLDNLVFALSQANLAIVGKTLTAAEERALQFPICDKPSDFKSALKKNWLVGLSPPALALITAHQPYGGAYADLAHSPIRRLRSLQNVDKHRYLLALGTEPGNAFIHSIPRSLDVEIRPAPALRAGYGIVDGAELVRFVFGRPENDVDVNFKPTFHIALDDGSRVESVLDGIRTQVKTILHNAEKLPEAP